jgi:peroxiredoxin
MSFRLTHVLLAGAAALALTLGGVSAGLHPPGFSDGLQPANVRKAAPDFALQESSGKIISLKDLRGKVVLLNFWATWCGGCKQEIPWYMEFAGKYQKSGLVIVGASMDDDGWKSVRPFLEGKKLNYPIVIGDQSLADQYGLNNMPLSVLIDGSGRIADSHAGVVDKDGWEKEIQALLKEISAPSPK